MRRIGLLLVFVLCVAGTVVGQEEISVFKKPILKFEPLSLFRYENTIQLGVEVPLPNSPFAIQQELGWGHGRFNIWYWFDNYQ